MPTRREQSHAVDFHLDELEAAQPPENCARRGMRATREMHIPYPLEVHMALLKSQAKYDDPHSAGGHQRVHH